MDFFIEDLAAFANVPVAVGIRIPFTVSVRVDACGREDFAFFDHRTTAQAVFIAAVALFYTCGFYCLAYVFAAVMICRIDRKGKGIEDYAAGFVGIMVAGAFRARACPISCCTC